jgi:phosphatidylserine/phosphatidylglycerophosphate/cardiolipin synthase-like enzyme
VLGRPNWWIALAIVMGIMCTTTAGFGATSTGGAASVDGTASVTTARSTTPQTTLRYGTKRWMPPRGAVFNVPYGDQEAKTRIMSRIRDAVRHTRSGQTIRFAMYSFDRPTMADALIAAHRRGVHVQMVLNDNWTSRATKRLRRVLGTNRHKRHFAVICHQSCRGGPGNLHTKVYSFTKTGGAEDVIMTGSANITDRGVNLQWNDLYTLVNKSKLFDVWRKVFNQIKNDEPVRPRWIYFKSDTISATFYKENETESSTQETSTTTARLPSADEDPVPKRLKAIRCDAMKGSGINGHTVVRIIMFGWQDERGKRLARRVAEMRRHGCNIRVIQSVPGAGVRHILTQAQVPQRSADWNYTAEGPNYYNHQKLLMVNGTFRKKPTRTVWTGSENWSTMSFRNDEITLQINNPRAYRRYVDRFNFMWNGPSTHRMGAKPLCGPLQYHSAQGCGDLSDP